MKRLHVFTWLPLHKKLEEDLSLKSFKNSGINVVFVDLSEMLLPIQTIKKDNLDYEVVCISSWVKLSSYVFKERKNITHALIYMPLIAKTLLGYIILFRIKGQIAHFSIGHMPREKYIKAKFWSDKFKITFRSFILKILSIVSLIKKFDVVFFAGKKGLEINPTGEKFIPFNHYDMDRMLKKKHETEIQKRRYWVFIDSDLTQSSDLIALGYKLIEEDEYLNQLDRFFKKIELRFNIDIVVSAHPKSRYKNTRFNKREIFKGQSFELVESSEGVLIHNSTALNFAVLQQKPIIFMTSNDIIKK